MGLFDKLKEGLSKTTSSFNNKISEVLSFGRKIDEELFEELEEVLIETDMGVNTALDLINVLRERCKADKVKDAEGLKEIILDELTQKINNCNEPINYLKGQLNVVLVTGVNGVGKTTSIGKLAARLKNEGYSVLLCAADTFRAAAADQLEMWANRSGVDIIRHNEGADPGAVVFDACKAAQKRNYDILLIDTAGRLQNKNNLMAELGKIGKIIDRELPDVHRDSYLVLDASTGQNAISQAKAFKEILDINGIILTKLDGTAKGGIVVGIIDEMAIPIKLIGVGEGIEDLQDFDSEQFAKALFDKFRTIDETKEENE